MSDVIDARSFFQLFADLRTVYTLVVYGQRWGCKKLLERAESKDPPAGDYSEITEKPVH